MGVRKGLRLGAVHCYRVTEASGRLDLCFVFDSWVGVAVRSIPISFSQCMFFITEDIKVFNGWEH